MLSEEALALPLVQGRSLWPHLTAPQELTPPGWRHPCPPPPQVDVVRPAMPLVALALTVVLCAVPVAQVAGVLRASGLAACTPVIALHSFGYLLGYTLPKVLGFNEKTSRTGGWRRRRGERAPKYMPPCPLPRPPACTQSGRLHVPDDALQAACPQHNTTRPPCLPHRSIH